MVKRISAVAISLVMMALTLVCFATPAQAADDVYAETYAGESVSLRAQTAGTGSSNVNRHTWSIPAAQQSIATVTKSTSDGRNATVNGKAGQTGTVEVTHTYQNGSTRQTETFVIKFNPLPVDNDTPYEVSQSGSVKLKGAVGSTGTWAFENPTAAAAIAEIESTDGNTAVIKGKGAEGDVVVVYSYRLPSGTTGTQKFKLHFGPPVDKTVQWTEEGKTAEIIIQSVQTKEGTGKIPNVLFLGSLCSSHSLTEDSVETAINGLAEVANVEYHLYGLRMSDLSNSYAPQEGTVEKGGKISSIQHLEGQMHISHFYFAEVLKNADLSKYDLIVMEFDGARMVDMGNMNRADGLSEDEIVSDLKTQYNKEVSEWSDHYRQNDLTYGDLVADLAAAAFKLQKAYAENKVAWLVPELDSGSGSAGFSRGGRLLYDDNVFGGNSSSTAIGDNLKSAAWDGLALIAPEVWLEKDASGNYIQAKRTQPTTTSEINQALFTEGSQYKANGENEIKDGKGLWTVYGDIAAIQEFVDVKSEELLRFQNININDIVSSGFKITEVKGQYLDEKANPVTWVDLPEGKNFSWSRDKDNENKITAEFDLKGINAGKTRLVIDIEAVEEIIYEEKQGQKVVGTNDGEVEVVYDGDETTKTKKGTPVLPEPRIDIKKYSDPESGKTAYLDREITYYFKVTNLGEINIKSVKVSDPLLDFEETFSDITLEPEKSLVIIDEDASYTPAEGETVVKTSIPKHKVTEADLEAGEIVNQSKVEAETALGAHIYDEGDTKNPVKKHPFEVKKTSSYEGKDAGKPVKQGDTITYGVEVKNVGDDTLTNIVVKDNLSGVEAVPDSSETPAYTIDPNDPSKVTITSLGLNTTVTVTYTYEVTEQDIINYSKDGTKLVNTVFVEDTEGDTGEASVEDTPEIKTVDLAVEKVWVDDDNRDGCRPENVEIQLYKKVGTGSETAVTGTTLTLSESNSWEGTFEDLPRYEDGEVVTYSIKETTTAVITGTDGEGTYAFEVTGSVAEGFTVTNTHSPKLNLSVEKSWVDDDNRDGIRPDSVEIKLYKTVEGGSETAVEGKTLTLSASNSWTDTFEDLPKFEDGKEITYSVKETTTTVITGTDGEGTYAFEVTGNEEDGYTVTNTHTPIKIDPITVTKVWEDDNNRDGIRPASVEIKLYKKVGTNPETEVEGAVLTLSGDNSWAGTFEDLPKYENGTQITYSIKETTTEVITGTDGTGTYKYEITGNVADGFKVTNTHTPETVTVSGEKTWEDDNNRDGIRPTQITVNLTGKVEDETVYTDSQNVTKNKDEKWLYKFEGLYKYEAGKVITYTVSEESVEGYTPTVTGYDIKNTHTNETTSVTVSISWDDAENQDGCRPASVKVTLKANGETVTQEGITAEQEITGSGSYTWSGLIKNIDGTPIVYTVEETTTEVITGTDAEGTYAFEVTGDMEEGYVVTNTHTPIKTVVSGEKEWDDADDQDGKRPDSIHIILADGDGSTLDETDVSANDEGDWIWSFTDLDKYKDGTEAVYQILESPVEGYSTTYPSQYNVKNSYTPEQTAVNVTKVWDDDDDRDGLRPDSVSVQLYADGAEVDGKVLELSEANTWKGAFTGLPKNRDEGTAIEYTVAEVDDISGYDEPVITGDAGTGFIITNSHTIATTSVSGQKVWDDSDNNDGWRPASVTVKLLADGDIYTSTGVTGEGNTWDYTFDNLPVYRDHGTEIVYTVDETKTEVITGTDGTGTYAVTVEGTTITNKHTVETKDIEGEVVWEDADDNDGKRPESVTINLVGTVDGTPVSSVPVTVTDDGSGNWLFEFHDVPIYYGGKEITYIITEDSIPAYEATIVGTKVTNKHDPEKVSVDVVKVWDDGDNVDRKRPESITVRLLGTRDGVEYKTDSAVITEGDGGTWSYSFTDLPKYDSKVEIIYTVSEDPVDYYIATVDGYKVTNTHILDVYDIKVDKTVTNSPKDGKAFIVGEKIEYSIKVTNNGNIDITDIKVADSLTGEKWTIAKLEPGQFEEYKVSYTVTEADGKAGSVKNVATAEYLKGPDKEKVTKSGEATTPAAPKPYTPDTGDHSNTALFVIMLIAAAISGGSATFMFRRKRR